MTLDGKAKHLQHKLDIRKSRPKATGSDFEGTLVVDEVDHILEGLGVRVIEEEPLVQRIAQSGAEVRAGNGKKEPVTTKLLPEYIVSYSIRQTPFTDSLINISNTSEWSRIRQKSEPGSPGQVERSRGQPAPSDSSPRSGSSLEAILDEISTNHQEITLG